MLVTHVYRTQNRETDEKEFSDTVIATATVHPIPNSENFWCIALIRFQWD